MKVAFIMLFAIAAKVGFAAEPQSPATPSSNAAIAWGVPVNGLSIGISCDTNGIDPHRFPKIFFYAANTLDKQIPGIIQSGAECIVNVNGQDYAQYSRGGKGSVMPAGRKYGPIEVDVYGLRPPSDLTWRSSGFDESRPGPELHQGTNTVSLLYRWGAGVGLVKSGTVIIVLPKQ